MKVRYSTTNLAFKYPFTISRGTKTHQPSLIVELEHLGVKGYGEAPAISYYNIPIEKMIDDLERKKQFVEKFAFTEPARYWHYLHHLFPQNNFLVCALDIAAWDLFGKMRGQPLYKIWGLNIDHMPLCDYTIGIDTIGKMIEKIRSMPWPIYKIKLGTQEDIEIVMALRQHTSAVIRVDANAAWSVEEALEKIPVLHKLDVELIEQPLGKDDWEGMLKLYESSTIPLIADESCVYETDVDKCRNHFHGINIKLTKCSGITPALRMIETARKSGLKVMVGSMNESTIGSAAIGQLLPLLDYVDMDGPLLLADDVATGISFDNGKVILSKEPGLGITLTDTLFPI
jgi:L-alanine-DL-glutamate epimerase-like enolase superfamily enzyme